jgi:hypothetical protein
VLPPVLHAGGFSWDEALVLVVAIAIVPAISWFAGRLGKRRPDDTTLEQRRDVAEGAADEAVQE